MYEKWILENNDYFCAFLAGYIDAEGHIFTRLQKKSITPFSGLEIQTYDKTILHQTWEKLNQLVFEKIHPFIKHQKRRNDLEGAWQNTRLRLHLI